MRFGIKYLFIFLVLSSCQQSVDHKRSNSKLFTLLSPSETGIEFENNVIYEEEFNVYTYRNFYNGAGVGLGDINNDGLIDIYFCGNQESNRLYLNKGGLKFEDITEKAGVACEEVWSTGISMADINGDGFLDLYVCKSGSPEGEYRHNELFINNGDLTFTESAKEYGLADLGLSNHAAFFDYDKDGDLDCYLLNNSLKSFGSAEAIKDIRQVRDSDGANKLYRNDGGHFEDVSEEAGIYGSAIGFGLGVTIGDVNQDGWQDIYVSNDFFEKDYLYINNRNGTFSECVDDQMSELSLGSMGADMGDIDNDGYPEIFVTEMLPEGEERLKTKSMFESWEKYTSNVVNGYHHQFARNVLQLNNQNNTFSEIGRYAGVEATDWSWSALIMDMDNDGWKDLFVANGIYKDLLDQDYIGIYTNPSLIRNMMRQEEGAILKLIDAIPSEKISNYAYKNNHDLTFSNKAREWGLDELSHSNGSAFGDLDNDGDLDLVVNNVNMPPFVYRNNNEGNNVNNYLQLELNGDGMNTTAIGSQIKIKAGNKTFYQELIPTRGFMSSIDPIIHIGLGAIDSVDSIIVTWPDDKITILTSISANQRIKLKQKEANFEKGYKKDTQEINVVFENISSEDLIDHQHHENDFVDFNRDKLLYHMLSTEGPKICKGDINGDGLEDLYIGGAKNSPGALMVQSSTGTFIKTNIGLFEKDKMSEDSDCIFFDADNDDDLDLYVASGGNEFSSTSSALGDRLYINDGRGQYIKSNQILPAGRYESTSTVEAADFDGDGDMDLFAGIRLKPFLYGVPTSGYLLKNDGKGSFQNVTNEIAPYLEEIGMITDASWADLDGDKDADLVIVGDWMPIIVLINDGGSFTSISDKLEFEYSYGWWNCIEAGDLDQDGDIDLVLGNHGLNSRFKCNDEKPIKMYVNDFDANGKVEHIITKYNDDQSYPMVQQNDLIKQIPGLNEKYPTFSSYKNQKITDIFNEEILNTCVILQANNLSSSILWNKGELNFDLQALPKEVQFSPVYGIGISDFDDDENLDIVVGGNFYNSKPESGIYGASYGSYLKGDGNGNFEVIKNKDSGFLSKGEIRDFEIIQERNILLVVKNNDKIEIFKY